MEVLAANIEENRWNTTRFIIVSKMPRLPPRAAAHTKSSVVFSMKSVPGALLTCLNVFARRGINLYKIESRPIPRRARGFAYLFYLDFDGDARSREQKEALRELQTITTFYRFLGSYLPGLTCDPAYRPRRP